MLPFLLLTGHFLDKADIPASITLILILTALYSPGAGVSVPQAKLIFKHLGLTSACRSYRSCTLQKSFRRSIAKLACPLRLGSISVLQVPSPWRSRNIRNTLGDPDQHNQHLVLLGSFAALDFVAAVLVWLFMRYPEKAVELEDMNVRSPVRLQSGRKLTCAIASSSYLVHPHWIIYTIRSRLPGDSFDTLTEALVSRIGRKIDCTRASMFRELWRTSRCHKAAIAT